MHGEHLAELTNFPLVNQRTGETSDGNPSENADYNCVVANLVACIFYFHREYSDKLTPDAAKDAVLGEGTTGCMDIRNFIVWARAYGVNVQAFTADHAAQVAEAHRQIRAGNPVIFTGDDPYNPNYTHMYTWYKEIDGGLVALDPMGAPNGPLLGGIAERKSDADWAGWLRADECWIVTNGVPMLQYTEQSRDFSVWYTAMDANHWKCKQTGKIVQFGIKAFYQRLSIDGQSLPLPGLPLTDEVNVQLPAGQIVLQVYERAGIVYDPQHLKDRQPGLEAAYLVHLQDQDFLRLISGLQLPEEKRYIQTVDSTAYCDHGTMADGNETHDGAVAMNDVEFGTQFRILSGPLAEKVVVVEDRIGSGSQFDIWMEDCDAAIQYGRRQIQIQQLCKNRDAIPNVV